MTCLLTLNFQLTLNSKLFLQPTLILHPHMQPNTGHRLDGIEEDHAAVFFEVLAPLGLLHEIGHVLLGGKLLRDEIGSEGIGVLRHGPHIGECAAALATPSVDVFLGGQFFLDVEHQRRGLERERIALRVVEEAVVVPVEVVRLGDLVLPFLLDVAVYVGVLREGTGIAVQRHVTVGHIMAQDEETHGDVVARRR